MGCWHLPALLALALALAKAQAQNLTSQCSNDLITLEENHDYKVALKKYERVNKDCLQSFDHAFCITDSRDFAETCHELGGTLCSCNIALHGDDHQDQSSRRCVPNSCNSNEIDLAVLGDTITDETEGCDGQDCVTTLCLIRETGKRIFAGGNFYTNQSDLTIGFEFNQPINCDIVKATLTCPCLEGLHIDFPYKCESDDKTSTLTFSMLNVVPFALGEEVNMTITHLLDAQGHQLEDLSTSFVVQDFDHTSAIANIRLNISIHSWDQDFLKVWRHALAAELDILASRIQITSVTFPDEEEEEEEEELAQEMEEATEGTFEEEAIPDPDEEHLAPLNFVDQDVSPTLSSSLNGLDVKRAAMVAFDITCAVCEKHETTAVDVAQSLVLKLFPKTTLSLDVNEILRMPENPDIQVNVISGDETNVPQAHSLSLGVAAVVIVGGMLVLGCLIWRYNLACQEQKEETVELGLQPSDLPQSYMDDEMTRWGTMNEPLLETKSEISAIPGYSPQESLNRVPELSEHSETESERSNIT